MKNRHFKKLWFLLVCLSVLSSIFIVSSLAGSAVDPLSNDSQPKAKAKNESLSQHIVEYHIDVELNEAQKSLHGTQTLTWTNPGERAVQELYFHLYPNAFQSKKTSFMRESGGKLRNDSMKKGSFGEMRITALQTVDGENLASRMQYVQPDDGNKGDMTLMKVKLLEPVQPGSQITLHMRFDVKLPSVFARMGYVDDFIMAGQWFPKIAVYETAGTRDRETEGWNLHQYHGNSEFYANFGIYNVRIHVPSHYMVAATGFPTNKTVVQGDRKTYHFYAEDVHDFAWAASPHFVYVEEPFSTPHVPGVKIKLYLDPKHAHLKERYLYAAKKSLARYSEWYGEYPYSTLSIVVPPDGGNGAGGMEYPTLITAWAASDESPGHELERVIVHEIGHQFWYGMVASNEFEEAWLDEGFTSYAEDKVMESEYGIYSNTPVESSYITSPAPLHLWSWQYQNHSQYADNVYTRAKLVLQGIEQEISTADMDLVMKTYFQRWKFKHPSTADFQRVLEEVTKRSWKDYFDQFIYGGLMIDYAVESIKATPIEHQDKTVYENIVSIRKHGGHHNPVPILFHFANHTSAQKTWNGLDTHIQFKLVHDAPIDWVAIDPDYSIILENKHINNFMRTSVADESKIRWSLGTVKFIETLIEWVAW